MGFLGYNGIAWGWHCPLVSWPYSRIGGPGLCFCFFAKVAHGDLVGYFGAFLAGGVGVGAMF